MTKMGKILEMGGMRIPVEYFHGCLSAALSGLTSPVPPPTPIIAVTPMA